MEAFGAANMVGWSIIQTFVVLLDWRGWIDRRKETELVFAYYFDDTIIIKLFDV